MNDYQQLRQQFFTDQTLRISLNDWLRAVVGGSIKSARTEGARLAFTRQWIRWHLEAHREHSVTAEELIARRRDHGFNEEQFELWTTEFLSWRAGMLTRRARSARQAQISLASKKQRRK